MAVGDRQARAAGENIIIRQTLLRDLQTGKQFNFSLG